MEVYTKDMCDMKIAALNSEIEQLNEAKRLCGKLRQQNVDLDMETRKLAYDLVGDIVFENPDSLRQALFTLNSANSPLITEIESACTNRIVQCQDEIGTWNWRAQQTEGTLFIETWDD